MYFLLVSCGDNYSQTDFKGVILHILSIVVLFDYFLPVSCGDNYSQTDFKGVILHILSIVVLFDYSKLIEKFVSFDVVDLGMMNKWFS